MFQKTALITGAAKRIGAATARYLHNQGMNVIVHYNQSAKEANELVRELNAIRNDSAITIQGNLEYKEYYPAIIDAALAFKGGLDVLINNASAFYPTPMSEVTEENWNALIHTNLKAPLFLSQLAAPSLRKAQGCIINITDIHGLRPLAEHAIYSISKSGLLSLTQSLAKELAPKIRVNAVSPGAIAWPENIEEDNKQSIMRKIPLAKTGEVDDIAKAITFLIRDADYITGQIINVDGGRTLYS